jgi:hypothetical protein
MTLQNIETSNNSIQFNSRYLRANSAQAPITNGARVKERNKHVQSTKQGNL